MMDIVKWIVLMVVITLVIIVLRTLFRKPPGSNHKRWTNLSTPELLNCAFNTVEMYDIAERTAKRHLNMYGVETVVDLYTEIYKEFKGVTTTDGYKLSGAIKDMGNERIALSFDLERDGEVVNYSYEVTYIHLLRVSDVLSPALLSKLDWHKKGTNSEG